MADSMAAVMHVARCKCAGHTGSEQWHGCTSGRWYHGCDCEACVEADRGYHRQYARLRYRGVPAEERRRIILGEYGEPARVPKPVPEPPPEPEPWWRRQVT